ncbi:MAG: hypothetical protein NC084_06310 [Bacteroides sp.]|nr:hypothetical protein [Eubacterium sp.]MCM1418162.1 hypothetical protein [Roseburia sp.]MCM1462313.1 hypothetical protein [Bacteroides sp.]
MVSTETGEVLDTLVFDAESQDEYRFSKPEAIKRKVGDYVIINFEGFAGEQDMTKISPRILSSYLFLASFADDKYRVAWSNHKAISEKDIRSFVGDNTLDTLLQKHFVCKLGNALFLNRRTLFSHEKPINAYSIRCVVMFKEAYRCLFRSLDNKGRTTLGHIIRALPMTNYRWNCVSYNLREEYKEDIDRMNAEELNEALFQNKQNVYQWLKKATSITYVHDTHEYRLCMYQTPTKSNFGGFFISPYLFYRGKDIGAARSVRSGKDGKDGWIVEI